MVNTPVKQISHVIAQWRSDTKNGKFLHINAKHMSEDVMAAMLHKGGPD
jgi:hypothetical protein